MIAFSNPAWFVLLIVPALLTYWIWTRRSGRIAFPLDHANHHGHSIWPRVLRLFETIPPLLLAIVIAVLAGPQKLGVPKEKRSLTNIQFCVDVSLSMKSNFGEMNRYEHAMNAINQFVDYRTGDAFGLSFFGNAVIHWVPLTTDSSALKCSTPFMNPKRPNHPPWLHGTQVGNALMSCRDVLKARADGERLIILISDGESFDLEDGRAQEVAAALREDEITVIDVHVAPEEVPPAIATIATLTGGEVFNPGDPETLETTFKYIDKLMKVEMERTVGQPIDNSWPFCLAALGLLGLYSVSLFGLRHTPW